MSEWEEEIEPVVMRNVDANPESKLGIKQKMGIFLIILSVLAVMCLIAKVGIKSYHHSQYKDEFFVQQEAKEYLEERYGEEFTVMFNRGMGGVYNYVQLYAYPINDIDEKHKIEIQGYYNEKGKLDYYDDYVMVRLTDEYEAYIDPIIDEYFDEYKFYLDFDAEWLTNNLPADTELEDLWQLKANEDYPLPTLTIFFGTSENEGESVNNLKGTMENLRSNYFRGCVETLFFLDDKLYKNITRNNNHKILDGQRNKYNGNVIFIYKDRVEY